jgi:ABC-2 type transport system ATP-binding protein
VLLSTHNLDEVERVANRVAVLRTKLIASDTPAALRTRLFGARLRVGVVPPPDGLVAALRAVGFNDVRVDNSTLSIGVDDAEARAPMIVRHLVEAGAEIRTVAPEEPPLEQVYLRLLEEEQP